MGKPTPTQILQLLSAIGRTVNEVVKAKTERQRIASEERVQIAEIAAKRDLVLAYLDRTFDERRLNFEKLFDTLDSALTKGNNEVATTSMDAIVTLAKSSPFKDLADVTKMRARLAAKSDWQF